MSGDGNATAVDLYWLPLGACGSFVRLNGRVYERLAARGVAVEGPVGGRLLGRSGVLRYEVRCWRGGSIPDVGEAVDSPRRLTDDLAAARRILELVPSVPRLVWGRDELGVGEMWNSNSVVAWLLARAGLPAADVSAPDGGRAPGWDAGVAAAARPG